MKDLARSISSLLDSPSDMRCMMRAHSSLLAAFGAPLVAACGACFVRVVAATRWPAVEDPGAGSRGGACVGCAGAGGSTAVAAGCGIACESTTDVDDAGPVGTSLACGIGSAADASAPTGFAARTAGAGVCATACRSGSRITAHRIAAVAPKTAAPINSVEFRRLRAGAVGAVDPA